MSFWKASLGYRPYYPAFWILSQSFWELFTVNPLSKMKYYVLGETVVTLVLVYATKAGVSDDQTYQFWEILLSEESFDVDMLQ